MSSGVSLRIGPKLIIGTCATVIVTIALLIFVSHDLMKETMVDLGKEGIANVVEDLAATAKMQNDITQEKLESDLYLMDQEFQRLGDPHLDPEQSIEMTMVNQVTKEKETASIPSLVIGNTVINNNFDLVDSVQRAVGGTATIFQVVGDRLLRVSTNVLKLDGERAVGTYIPDSSPVYQTVMSGETFRGRAYVVNAWYLTAYKPFRDPSGRIIGVIYVGRKVLTPQFAEVIKSADIGGEGYAFVFNSKGEILIHPDTAIQGTNMADHSWSEGFMKADHSFVSYDFKDESKVGYAVFYEPWDWHMAFAITTDHLEEGLAENLTQTALWGLGALVLAVFMSVALTRSITRPMRRAVDVADALSRGDLSKRMDLDRGDEIGELARAMDRIPETLLAVLEEMEGLTRAMESGELGFRADESRFQGSYADLIGGANDMGDALGRHVHRAVTVAVAVAAGDLSQRMDSTGDNEIGNLAQAVNKIPDTLEEVLGEFARVADEIKRGILYARGDSAGFSGSYSDLIGGANSMTRALTGFIDMLSPCLIVDEAGTIRFISRSALDALGLTLKEASGRPIREVVEVTGGNVEECYALKEATGEASLLVGGRAIEVAFSCRPIKDEGGRIVGNFKVFNDQTETKTAQRQAQAIADFQRDEIESILSALQAVAEGDLTSRYEAGEASSQATGAREDFLRMSQALNTTLTNLQEMLSGIKSSAHVLTTAASDLAGLSADLLSDSQSMSSQASVVASTTEQVSMNINTMASASEEMSVNVNSVSSTAEEMSANMNSVARSIEDMTSAMRKIAENAGEGSRIAVEATETAARASETMGQLGQAAQDIGKVTELIKRIAEQTNLLALNATIEAASAGEAGKGFAVVAGEIKELANQSAKAAEDIADRIGGIQDNTRDAVEAMDQVSGIIASITESVTHISKEVEAQNRTASEVASRVDETSKGAENIASSISEVAKGAGEMSQNAAEAAKGSSDAAESIQEVNASAETSTGNAERVKDASDRLATVSDELQELVVRFKVD